MYKVFIQEIPVFFTKEFVDNIHAKSVLCLHVENFEEFELIISSLDKMQNTALQLRHADVDALWAYFVDKYKPIEAAGGVVKHADGRTLFIIRHDKWDLPKGKIEQEESPEVAAIREVEEECGVSGLTITKALPSTLHTYERDGVHYLKKTHWFEMKTQYKGTFQPQTEEGITAVVWLGNKEFDKVRSNTYGTVVDLITD